MTLALTLRNAADTLAVNPALLLDHRFRLFHAAV
jgi:hypothetical protein